MEQELTNLALDAKAAINKLKALQNAYMRGVVSYDEIQEKGRPLIVTYNKYAKAMAKARKMSYKPISLGYFLR